MSVIRELSSKIFQKVIDHTMGSGLMQEETTAEGTRYITPGIPEAARQAAAEGCVLLKNNGILPLSPSEEVSVFGRCQIDWFYVGYGSGGDVKAPYYTNLTDAMKHADVSYNKELLQVYTDWCASKDHKADHGWWAHWPTSHPEMPLSEDLVKKASERSSVALVVIGRSAGEERESTLTKGSYFLTEEEIQMIDLVTKAFSHTIVIIDTGSIIDMSWLSRYGDSIDAVLYAFFGGMESGNAVCDILYGKTNPSGRLTDTIAVSYDAYPSSPNFGGLEYNEYKEGIFVGYRYFDTYAPDKVLFPFGFGLSYSSFQISDVSMEHIDQKILCTMKVSNTGSYAGQEVVMLWCHLPGTEVKSGQLPSGHKTPEGRLEKPLRILAGFTKTPLLEPGESCSIQISCFEKDLASYEEDRHVFLLEEGTYTFSANKTACGAFTLAAEKILQQCEPVMSPSIDLKRRIMERIPEEIPQDAAVSKQKQQTPLSLDQVASGDISLDQFIATLSDAELEALTRGQGMMNSPYGTSGNTGAFGGIIPSLNEKGVEAIITSDGPSGLRLNRYTSLLPCGTALASTWNTGLVQELYGILADEMKHFAIDVLLAPGMNIHRNPLCGRNFEYYSEDPLLSGKMAAAAVRGIQKNGASACPKHFCCNNQETKRNKNNSIVSERALREIYLRNFEICIKESTPLTIMTSYNKVNGVWSHYNYDLVTSLLRKDWNFSGTVITDWWMQKSISPEFPLLKNNAYRVRAQVDVLMPGDMKHMAKKYKSDGTLLRSLGKPEGITKGELQRTARNVLQLVIQLKKRSDA